MSQNNNDPVLNENGERESHGFLNKIFGIFSKVQRTADPDNGSVQDDSYTRLQDQHGSMVDFYSGNVILKALHNLSLYASKHLNISVKGDKQEIVGGNSLKNVHGDSADLHGKQGPDERKAAEDYDNAHVQIQQARLDAIENTQGSKVACPVCSTIHLVDRSGPTLVDKVLGWLYKNVPFMCFPLDIVHKVLNALLTPVFLSPTENISLTGGKGCGSPGCVDGQIESPLEALKAADTASDNAMKVHADKINEASVKLKSGGAKFIPFKTDVIFRSGLKKNTAPAYKTKGHNVIAFALTTSSKVSPHRTPAQAAFLALDSSGSCKKVIYCEPHRTHGSVFFDVSNNFTVNAGTPGINLQTGGRVRVDAGDMLMTASQGEAVFGSSNLTTVKGKNIILAAQDFSGDSGVSIESAQTLVTGGFSVKGNAAIKGHLTCDGSLSIPHLICPSMRTESTESSPSKFALEGANWFPVNAGLKSANFAKDLGLRYTMLGYTPTLRGMTALVMEAYDLAMQSKMFEHTVTGMAIGTCFTPLGMYPVLCYPPFGFVLNHVHNHTRCGEDHSHTMTSPMASYHNHRLGWGAERQGASPVPTVPPAYGDSPSPGPKSKPSGACPSGGLYTKGRNEVYNLNTDVPTFFDNEYHNYIPVQIKRSGDGNTFTGGDNNTAPFWSRMLGVPSLSSIICGLPEKD